MRRGGTIEFKVDGVTYLAKGEYSYHMGTPKRETVSGPGKVHGFKETAQPAYIEGAITDDPGLDVKALRKLKDVTVTLALGVGKTIMLSNAWECGDGMGKSDEGELGVRFESAEEGQEI